MKTDGGRDSFLFEEAARFSYVGMEGALPFGVLERHLTGLRLLEDETRRSHFVYFAEAPHCQMLMTVFVRGL